MFSTRATRQNSVRGVSIESSRWSRLEGARGVEKKRYHARALEKASHFRTRTSCRTRRLFSTYTMPRRTTVRLVLVALVALATSATLADAQSAERASARPAIISGRRPGVDVQVDRPSSRGNKNDKPSKWGELCDGFGVTP